MWTLTETFSFNHHSFSLFTYLRKVALQTCPSTHITRYVYFPILVPWQTCVEDTSSKKTTSWLVDDDDDDDKLHRQNSPHCNLLVLQYRHDTMHMFRHILVADLES